ncbi:NERD domain-containing protein [Desulfobulbus elongatus]|uniref:NERD domain-containing protein n=1 Tax=Desulfobulbus elongatus TaxID=53332 RepID=UPI000483196E
MILKEKVEHVGQDERSKAGYQQEKDVAFYLRREFGNDPSILIINDLRFEYNGERAQIDHLVIHLCGLVVIESKSIYGEVKVNGHGEWSRSYRGEWYGMSSPVRQAELQVALLKNLLRDNVEKFLGRLLGLQIQIGGRDWRSLCAVSSSTILHRDEMPREITDRVVKSEFIAEKVLKLVGSRMKSLVTAKPRFSQKEIKGIGEFLLKCHLGDAQTSPLTAELAAHQSQITPVQVKPNRKFQPQQMNPIPGKPEQKMSHQIPSNHACKKCGETGNLHGQYGKFGYYVRCGSCGTNTSMKANCPSCQSHQVRIHKSGPVYTSTCQNCAHEWVVFQQPNIENW